MLHNEHAKERVIAKALPPPGVDFLQTIIHYNVLFQVFYIP